MPGGNNMLTTLAGKFTSPMMYILVWGTYVKDKDTLLPGMLPSIFNKRTGDLRLPIIAGYFIYLNAKRNIMSMIPIKDVKKRYSAMVSNLGVFLGLFPRIAIKEDKQERMSNMDKPDENSSIRLESDLFVKWNEVITTRQKPKRLVDGLKICWDELLAINAEQELKIRNFCI